MCNCKGGVRLGAAPIKLPGFPLWSSEQCSPRYCRKLALTVNYHTAHRLCVSQLLRICLLYWGSQEKYTVHLTPLFWESLVSGQKGKGQNWLIVTVLVSAWQMNNYKREWWASAGVLKGTHGSLGFGVNNGSESLPAPRPPEKMLWRGPVSS